MQLSIKKEFFLSLLAVLIGFLVFATILVNLILNSISGQEISRSMENSYLSYNRFEEQRRTVLRTVAKSIAQAAHLRATLSIPDVDSGTVYIAGSSLTDIASSDLFLIVSNTGKLLSNIYDPTADSNPNLREFDGIDLALAGNEYHGYWNYSGKFFSVSIVPCIVGERVVGVIVAGERRDTESSILGLEEMTGADVIMAIGNQVYSSQQGDTANLEKVNRLFAVIGGDGVDYSDYLGLGSYPVDGETIYTAVIEHEPNLGFTFLYRADGDFAASTDSAYTLLFGGTVLTLILGILASYWISARLSKPIKELTIGAREFGEGNYEHRVKVPAVNELGALARALNQMAQDTAERQRAVKQANKEKQKAEWADLAKSEFLANMSHEIRTPLNGIQGMTNVLLHSDLELDIKDKLNVVWESSETLYRLVNDVLDLSKLDAGQVVIESIEFNIRELFNNQLLLWQERYEEKGLYLRVSVDKNIPAILVGDPTRLRQILSNLINNALKFSAQGGTSIEVSGTNGSKSSRTLEIVITDTGVGFDNNLKERLFDRFVQADSSTTREFGGTGLGLAICKELVMAMGGAINVESESGEGTMFSLVMDFKIGNQRQTEFSADNLKTEIAPQHTIDNSLRVLVAEDNVVNQQVIKAILGKRKLACTIVGNGAEAVAETKKNEYDLILMDIQMPVMGGVEALRSIRRLPGNTSSIPIIALTANAMSADREHYLNEGFNDYLEKPINFIMLDKSLAACSRLAK